MLLKLLLCLLQRLSAPLGSCTEKHKVAAVSTNTLKTTIIFLSCIFTIANTNLTVKRLCLDSVYKEQVRVALKPVATSN